ncbi:MAG: 16S rRNA (adenine(1518)-N(6)/adenine(1519)-N(6))-dimethyltransferase RsmA [Candidatus Hodarchaeales archaeon]|jgi:16S rRNA (adenine1518-N6/adenine1519-N6)-dimethyltransferase
MDPSLDPATLDSRELYRLTRLMLRNYAINPRSALGQHFVVDANLIKTLISAANVEKENTILEVGSGLGFVTQALALRAKKVIAIEKDPLLVSVAQTELIETKNVEVLRGDALRVDLPHADIFVSNLPFEISTPMTFRILSAGYFERLAVSYQKEYAFRTYAKPQSSEYGRLTVKLAYYGNFRLVKTFPPRSFYPSPKVAASVVATQLNNPPKIVETPAFDWLLQTIFSRKHKRLRNTLLRAIRKKRVPGDVEVLPRINDLEDLAVMKRRAITLSPDEILSLAELLFSQ